MDKIPKKSLDIQQILDKIETLPIDDTDKATILEEIKKNITHPSAGENQNLDNIQSKYTKMNMPYGNSNYGQEPMFQQMHKQFNPNNPNNSNSNQQGNYINYEGNNPNASTPMTSVQFEILKNKLDSLQFELIDLLRHVKDYTQRYMNAIRQQDLDKINEYINGLFEVDKKLKETQALADTTLPEEGEEGEGEDKTKEEAQASVITRATSGIKNFFGSIGNNVSGITDLVKSTADVANGYLTKKVIPSNNSNANVTTKSSTINNSGKTLNNTSVSRNKNIISVDDYISDMNKMEEMNNSTSSKISNTSLPISNSNIVSSSSNNINSLGSNTNINNIVQPKKNIPVEPVEPIKSNEPVESNESNESNEPVESNETDETENLEGALKKLNDKMNEDIEKTVKNNNNNNNNITIPEQTGGKRTLKNTMVSKKENNLTHKIKLLRLKLTKNKLQKQLSENNINNKHNHNNHNKHIDNKHIYSKTKKKHNYKKKN